MYSNNNDRIPYSVYEHEMVVSHKLDLCKNILVCKGIKIYDSS